MPIITISRGSLSGGARLAELLGARLGCRVVAREVIVQAARKYGVTEEQLAEGLRDRPSLWSRLTRHADDYVLAVQETLASMVEHGDVVYHGLAGAFLLAGLPGVLKLRLVAPRYQRVEAAMRELGVGRERASAHVDEVDAQRARWVRALYDEDWADPAHYDLVVNVGDMSLESAAAMVTAVARRPEYEIGPEVALRIHDFATRCRIYAHLRLRSPFREIPVDVAVHDGTAELTGGRDFALASEEILRFVTTVPGVERVGTKETTWSVDSVAEASVAQFMVPLSRYPSVQLGTSVARAVAALRRAASEAALRGERSPRYVLVVDSKGTLRGLVGRRDLLRGLSPELRSVERALGSVSAMLPQRAADEEPELRWASLFGPGALDASRELVESVMRAAGEPVAPSDSVERAVRRMLQHDVDLVPVVDAGAVAGVVRMTDLFALVEAHLAREGHRG